MQHKDGEEMVLKKTVRAVPAFPNCSNWKQKSWLTHRLLLQLDLGRRFSWIPTSMQHE